MKSNQITQLVEEAKTGNKASLEQLLDHFYVDIFRMVYYRVSYRMDAEDLTQEIFAQMIKSLPNLKDSSLFRPWLFRLALNRTRDFHRKKNILSFFGSTGEIDVDIQAMADGHSDPTKNMIRKEFQFQLQKFTESLSRWEREVFILRFLDQLEIKEIVKILKKMKTRSKPIYTGH